MACFSFVTTSAKTRLAHHHPFSVSRPFFLLFPLLKHKTCPTTGKTLSENSTPRWKRTSRTAWACVSLHSPTLIHEFSLTNYVQSALESSFNIPPPPPKSQTSVPSQGEEQVPAPATSAPVPGLDEWPQTLQGYLDEWQAESAVARAKAEATRKKFEEERAAEAKTAEVSKKADKKNKEDEEKRKRDAERLRQELEGEEDEVQGGKGHGHGDKSRVKEAWELVAKKEGQNKDTPVVETDVRGDVRGVTGEDVLAGRAGEKEVKAVSTSCSTGGIALTSI